MSKGFLFTSFLFIALTVIWLGYEFSLRHFVRWHFLAAGGIHFIISIIINRQFTHKDINYLGWVHVSFAVLFFACGYFFL